MAASIAGYRGRNWTDWLSAFASLYSVGGIHNLEPGFWCQLTDLISLVQKILVFKPLQRTADPENHAESLK